MKYAVVDLSGTKSQAELAAYASAQQRQLREHYALCYDGDGDQDDVRVATALSVAADEFPIRLHPSVPAANANDGAIGEHALDGADIYLDLCAKFGVQWTTTSSHEVLESRADRRLHACVELDDGSIWDKEVCDRVEADEYEIDGVPMSNFNTPACFEPPPDWQERIKAPTLDPGLFDWMGTSSRPNEVRPGGYAQKFDPQQGWSQVGQMRGYREAVAKLGLSRGARRRARGARAALLKCPGCGCPLGSQTCAMCGRDEREDDDV